MWTAQVKSRTAQGAGCQYCSGTRVLEGFNDLATTNPGLAAEWCYERNEATGYTPRTVTRQSNKRFWWRCPHCGREWEAAVCDRDRGRGCSSCSHSMRVSFPEKAIAYYLDRSGLEVVEGYKDSERIGGFELDCYLPSLSAAVEYDGVAWHTDADRDRRKALACERSGIRLIRVRERGCPSLDGAEVIDIVPHDDVSLDEALGRVLDALGVSGASRAEVDVSKDRRAIEGRKLDHRFRRSLSTLHPDIAAEWHPTLNGKLDPSNVPAGFNGKAWWLGKCGHEWEATVNSRTSDGNGCPVCAGKLVVLGVNDLITLRPDLAVQWDRGRNLEELGLTC